MRRIPRPKVPSIARGHSRACVNRCQFRVRSRDGFRYGLALGAPSPTAPRTPLSRRTWLRCARPPSPRIAPFRDFHAKRRHALLWVRLPPNDFCNYIPTHGHTLECPILACFEEPHYAIASNTPSLSPPFLGSCNLPLSKKDYESREPRQSFRRRPYDAASAPQNTTSKATDQSRRRLRATPRPDHRLRR